MEESAEKSVPEVGVSHSQPSDANLATDNVVAAKNKKDVDNLIESATKLSLGETENKMYAEVPSQCRESIWIWSKTSEQIYSRLDDELGGKWLVFLDETIHEADGLTILDRAWRRVDEATLQGTFYQSKASTSVKEAHAASLGDNKGVIVVYTKDFDDLDVVLKTAENLATILEDLLPAKYALRYKTNAATDSRLYPSRNCKNVTLYRYTKRFGLQQREDVRWVTPPSLRAARGRVFNAPGRGHGGGYRHGQARSLGNPTQPWI